MGEKMKKIIIVDDDAIVRESLIRVLVEKNYQIIDACKNAEEAVQSYFKYSPDLVLMDIRMSGGSGLEASREILSRDKEAKILLLTTFHDKEYIDQAIKLGCGGYILKENISSLSSAIEAVLDNKIVFDSKIIENMTFFTEKEIVDNIKRVDDLSERENEVLKLISDGLSNKEIAEKLFLSEGTVRNYISTMLSKLELRDRTQLAIFYYKSLK